MRAGSFGSPAEPLIQLNKEDKEGKAGAQRDQHWQELGMSRQRSGQDLLQPLASPEEEAADSEQIESQASQ